MTKNSVTKNDLVLKKPLRCIVKLGLSTDLDLLLSDLPGVAVNVITVSSTIDRWCGDNGQE